MLFFSQNTEKYSCIKISKQWPEVPLLVHPRPSMVGLVELNKPDSETLVLVSGNNEYTEQVLMTVLGTTISPFYAVFVDTDGSTVDMAMIYQTLTAEGISSAVKQTLTKEEVDAFLYEDVWPDSLKEKLKDYILED